MSSAILDTLIILFTWQKDFYIKIFSLYVEEYAQPIDCENKFWPTTFAKYIPLPIPMDNLSSLE